MATKVKSKIDYLEVEIHHRLDHAWLSTMLCDVFEGSDVSSWVTQVDYKLPAGAKKSDRKDDPGYSWVPLYRDGYLIIKTVDEETHHVGWEQLQAGLQTFADKFPKRFAEFLEDYDGETLDMFFQCAALGDVIYG
jgi:hypothetical protein